MGRLYTRIEAEFNANWESGVIAEPVFFDMTKYSFHPANSIGIETDEPAPMAKIVSNNAEYGRGWDFQLHLFATTDANLELMIEQTIERINKYVSGNQRWHLNAWSDFSSYYGLKTAIASCNETSVITETAF